MKKLLFALLTLIVVAAAGFFYYFQYYQKRPDIWQLVPSNAFMAYESQNASRAWNNLIQRPVWASLSNIPFFNKAEKELKTIDSISGNDGSLDKLFRRYTFISSFHITSSSDFDVVYFLDLDNDRNRSTLRRIVGLLESDFNHTINKRQYQEIEITELKQRGESKRFSFFIYDNFFVGSFTPFLVEDVIRNINEQYDDSFYDRINNLIGLAKLSDDEGNLYIDFKKSAKAFEIFLKPEWQNEFSELASLAKNSFLDIKTTNNEILFNGTSFYPTGNPDYFLSVFEDQNPSNISIHNMLPERTAVLVHFAFTDMEKWKDKLARYWATNDEKKIDQLLDFETEYSYSFDWIDGEVGMVLLESIELERPEKIAIIQAKDAQQTFDGLVDLSNEVSKKQSDTTYFERYGDHMVYQLSIKEWPAMFLGDMFKGFENSYFTYVDQYIVVGNSMKTVRSYLSDLEKENVWGKSVRHNLFLENTLSESNFSLFVHTENSWDFLMDMVNDTWKNKLQTYERQVKSIDRIAYQINNLDNNFYTSLALGHQQNTKPASRASRFNKIVSTYTLAGIRTKPFVVKNHNNNRWEVLVQDKRNILYLISNEGEVLWGDSLKAPVVSEIHQIDYYKNGNLQYLFATPHKIFILDRNGDHVEDFPIELSSEITLEHLNVVDYDNSKRYRFMAVDKDGDVYLFDKEKVNLEGWKPRELASGLVEPGRHIRVKGGDCMLALQKNGIFNVINRRGNMYAGFPVDLKSDILEGLFVNIGDNFETTELTTVTAGGERISVNLKGEVLERKQLYKPSAECKFWLVSDALERTYVIVRQEYNKLSFIDRNGEIIFEKNIISSDDLDVQYYYFTKDRQLFAVTDKEQEFTYIFNNKGDLLNLEPVESSHEIGIIYYSGESTYHIYKCYNNNFSILTVAN